MKIAESTTEVTGNLQVAEEVMMNIDASASALVIRTLTNLYSNPYLAILREYSSNAYDSHVVSGQTRAVELGLPSKLNPNLVIEDFGVGLSREGLKAYGQYGLSSKTSSNDEIGGFGLGSKSGLAVASQFTVTAVKDGFKNTAVIGFDESGHPIMRFLNADPIPTDASSGLKITIPTSEVAQFSSAIDSQMFLGWPLHSIRINGAEPTTSVHNPDQYTKVDDWGWVRTSQAQSANYRGYHQYSFVGLVGPVKYDIQWDQLDIDIPYAVRMGYFKDAVLNLPIGSVDLVPSREELRYTARTKRAITEIVEGMVDKARKSYQEQVDQAESLRDALKLVITIDGNGFGRDYAYKGTKLVLPELDADKDWVVTRAQADSAYRSVGGTTREYFYTERSSDRLDRSWALDNLVQKSSVLVLNAGETEYKGRKGNEELVHPTASAVTNYDLALGDDEDGVYVYGANTYYFSSMGKKDFPKVMLAAFGEIIEYKDLFAVSEAKRIERAKESRANRKPAVKKEITDMKVRVVYYNNYGRSVEKETTLGALDTSTKWIILKADPKNDTLEHRTRRSILTSVGYTEDASLSKLVKIAIDHGYGILSANMSWKTEKYAEVLPNIATLSEALEAILGETIASLDPAQLRAAQDTDAGSSFYWVNYVRNDHLKDILNETTRTWLEAMQTNNAAAKYETIKTILKKSLTLGIDRTQYALPTASTTVSPGSRYPLLRDISHTNQSKLLVDYINWIDSKYDSE